MNNISPFPVAKGDARKAEYLDVFYRSLIDGEHLIREGHWNIAWKK